MSNCAGGTCINKYSSYTVPGMPGGSMPGVTEGIFGRRESIMLNPKGPRGQHNLFHERYLRVRSRVGVFGGSGVAERILVLMALSVLIFLLIFTTTACGGKLDPVLSRLADEYGLFGAEGASKFLIINELRARTSQEGQPVPVILDPLREGNAASTDRGGVREARAVVDAVSRSYMRVLVPVDRLRALSELPGIGMARVPIPAIQSITDVPADQGFEVEVAWRGSGYDYTGSPHPVVAYDIFRRNGVGGWDSIATVPAAGKTDYTSGVPTEINSTVSGGIAYTAFFVRGRTAAPVRYYVSYPDSGYSVDNVVPPPPTGLAIGYNDLGGNFVVWDLSPEPDIDHYNIYRGESDDFTPGPDALVHVTADTFWIDPVPDGYLYTYKVTAVDDAGNEGGPAAPVIRTDAECCEIPLRYNLHQNFPNPFNPITTIKFDIREPTRVRLVVYNVNGQRVRVLMDGEVPPGSREVVWNGRDDAGRSIASGVYFCRLESPGFVQSRKMILLK